MEQKKITIAIDGYSSCGKSTLAKQLADKLNYAFIDSGAMYRGITWYALENGFIRSGKLHVDDLIESLAHITIKFLYNPTTNLSEINVNNNFVESEIRKPRVASFVSKVARIKEVRAKLVQLQQEMGKEGGIVMDGRDIGSVVFPNAELKLFITAETNIRVQRRFDELKAKGIRTSLEEIKDNLLQRDLIDTTRKESPLIQTSDAIVIDNSALTREEQLEEALSLVDRSIKNITI